MSDREWGLLKNREIHELPISNIVTDPNQPRKYFDEGLIQELADSIAKHGLIQPILVRPFGKGKFQIVHGERRYRAHLRLGCTTIRAMIQDLTDDQVEDIRLVENVARNDLSDIELAWEFQRRVDQGQSHAQIAAIIGKSKAYVTQRLALLKLPREVQERMLRGELSFTNARILLTIKDANARGQISQQIGKDTTTRQTLDLVKPNNGAVTRVTAPNLQVSIQDIVSNLALLKLIRIPAGSGLSLDDLEQALINDLKTVRRLKLEGL